MSKKILVIIVIAGLVGGFFGSISASRFAQADLLGNIWGFITGSNATSTPGTPAKTVTPYAPTIDYEQAIVKAVQAASPSVVSIVISKDLPIIEQCPYGSFGDLPPEFRQFFSDQGFQFSQPCEKGTKKQEVGGGSGFIISSDGMILTNKHVVFDTKADYTVLTNDGKKHNAKVLARDPVQDLAVIKIDAIDLPVVTLGDSDTIKLGQTAIAIGNALGEFRNTVSVGVISGLSRTITASGGIFGSETLQNLIQTDAAINQGNSGGPLLNLKGEVIGINTAVASGAQNIGFTIPINQAKRDIESVKKTGDIKISYLGVRYTLITADMAKQQKLSVDYGALVRGNNDGPAVIKDSPAAKAGVQAEDIILEVNGVKVDENNSLGNLIQRYNIGDTITLKVQRGDKTIDIPVVLTERPAGQ
ncbi:PDZ domain-containing protein [bacterium]|nr:MAG: PDZ domain-containing protein [bacterium]